MVRWRNVLRCDGGEYWGAAVWLRWSDVPLLDVVCNCMIINFFVEMRFPVLCASFFWNLLMANRLRCMHIVPS